MGESKQMSQSLFASFSLLQMFFSAEGKASRGLKAELHVFVAKASLLPSSYATVDVEFSRGFLYLSAAE